jgi:hypothetical protein
VLLFPNVFVNGFIKQRTLLGDPFYSSRMKAAKDQMLDFGSVHLPNGSNYDGKTELLSLGEMFIGLVGSVFNLSTSNMYVFSSLITGLLILSLFLNIFKLFGWSGFNCLVFTIFSMFLFWGPFLPYGLERPISPQIVLLVWLFFIIVALKNVMKEQIKTSILVGLITAVSLYIHYPFIFLQILSGMFILLIRKIIRKENLRHLSIIIGVSLIFAIPNIVFNYYNSQSKEYEAILFRFGFVDSHLPVAYKTFGLGIIVISILIYLKRICKERNSIIKIPLLDFLIAQTIGCVAVSNSNLITGKSIEFSNHFDIFIYTLFIISTGLFLSDLKSIQFLKLIRSRKISLLTSCLVFFALISSTSIYANQIVEIKNPDINNQKIWDWVRHNISEDSGILFEVDAEAASTLLSQRLFYSRDLFAFNFLQSEVNKRFFVNNGCSQSRFTEKDFSFVSGVRNEILIHKIDRYAHVFNSIGLDFFTKNYLSKQRMKELETLELFKLRVESDFAEVKQMGCINFLKGRGVNYIFSPVYGEWSKQSEQKDLEYVDTIQGVNVYKVLNK